LVMICSAAIGCATDLTERRIPNWLTLTTALSGGILYYLQAGGAGLLVFLAGMVCAGGIFLFFYALGGFGGGDVKLVGSLGGLVGFPACFRLVMYVAVCGGLIAVTVLLRHRAFFAALKNIGRILFPRSAKNPEAGEAAPPETLDVPPSPTPTHPATIPYGLAVLLGVCWLYLEGGS